VSVRVAVGGTVAVGVRVSVGVGVGGCVGVVGDGVKVGAWVAVVVGAVEGVAAGSTRSFPLHPLSKKEIARNKPGIIELGGNDLSRNEICH